MFAAIAQGAQNAADRARTFDRPLLIIAAILLTVGVLISLASSPGASAQMRAGEAFYFTMRQSAFALLGVAIIAAASQASARTVRRIAVVLVAVLLPLCALVGLFAPDVRGAARWVPLGPLSFQPSEILKPALVIVWAWMLSEAMRAPRFPGRQVALALFAVAALVLLTQPDIGQTVLLALSLSAMLMLAGVRLRWLLGGLAGALVAAIAIYQTFPHARARIAGFLDPSGDAGYQVSKALDAIAAGGVFGRGPGEGVIKRTLPDAHADFVFAVAAEEFGLFASIGIIGLFGALAFRGLSRAARLNDPFDQLAAAGLTTLLAMQAAIHIAVNLSLAPAKGITLPLISYGGSSMIGAALAMGFLVALTRARPGAYIYEGRAP